MSGKKRGMSLESKRAAILDIFHESKEVYQLKDIEKLASKRGVVLQSIKDVLQSLVDDDLVHQEKLGISNYFWSFPSETTVKLQTETNKLQALLTARTADEQRLKTELAQSQVGKDDSVERQNLIRQVALLEEEIKLKQQEISNHSANDPERFEALKQAATVAKDSTNRWTDNIFTLRSWMGKKFAGMDQQLNNFFIEQGVSDDFDYIS